FFTQPSDEQFLRLIQISRNIICRPGYSTLMDLVALNRTAILVPTPGQSEQEYLARHFQANLGFEWHKQRNIRLIHIPNITKTGKEWSNDNTLLGARIGNFLLQVQSEKLRPVSKRS